MSEQPNKPVNPWDEKELGVLWRKESKNKEKYLSGVLNREALMKVLASSNEDIQLICFSNKNKSKDTHPDIRIYLSDKNDASKSKNSGASAPAKTAPAKVSAPAKAVPEPEPEPTPEDNDLI